MREPLRVAYTLEQCWHDVPGGSATAALNVARRLAARTDVELIAVAGRHRRRPDAAFQPPAILKEKVAKGELGLKSGKGFYAYSDEEALKFSALANEVVMQALRRAS